MCCRGVTPDPMVLPYRTSGSPRRRYLFIAGGIGITPILPMTAAAEAAGPSADVGPEAPCHSFELELRQSGLNLTVPADRSILRTVENAGVQVLSSCTEGTCGTCETDIVEGEADHRDSVLAAEEQAPTRR
jgi:ferredoxin